MLQINKVAVPLYFTAADLSDLFQCAANSSVVSSEEAISLDIKSLPIDRRIKRGMVGKEVVTTVSQNALVMVFSMFGYASGLGRQVECFAVEPDVNGNIIEGSRRTGGLLNPDLFTAFRDDPLAGAQNLFGQVYKAIESPERVLVLSFISPNPMRN